MKWGSLSMRCAMVLIIALFLSACGKDEAADHALKQMEGAAERMNEVLGSASPSSFSTDGYAFQRWAESSILPAMPDDHGLIYKVGFNRDHGNFGISVYGLSVESCEALADMLPKTGPRKNGGAYVLSASDSCHQFVPRLHDENGPSFYIGFCMPAAQLQCPPVLGLLEHT